MLGARKSDRSTTLVGMRVPFLVVCWAGLLPAGVFAQWQMQTSNTTADLRGIDNVGNGVAWASGTRGTVLRTEDGGYVWQTCAVPPGAEKLDFRGIQAFDANTAIVMSSGPGDQSRLYKTTDGCHTWKLVFTNPDKDGFWDAIQFSDRAFGVLIGDPVRGKIYARLTADGGRSWKKFDRDDSLKVNGKSAGIFAASNSALILPKNPNIIDLVANVGRSAKLYQAGFGKLCPPHYSGPPANCPTGSYWESPISLPIVSNSETSGGFSIAYDFDQDWTLIAGVVVGGDYKKPDGAADLAAYSSDEIVNWDSAQTMPHGYRSSVAYDEQDKLWITVGPNGTDVSADDGKNWRAVHPDPALHEAAGADRNWNAISLPFVVGPKGRIGRLESAAVKHDSDRVTK